MGIFLWLTLLGVLILMVGMAAVISVRLKHYWPVAAPLMWASFRVQWLAVHSHGRVREALLYLREALSDPVDNRHEWARSVGRVCWHCADRAPGWWDHFVDCGDHNCSTCEVCRVGACGLRPGGHRLVESFLLEDGCKGMTCQDCPHIQHTHLRVYGCTNALAV